MDRRVAENTLVRLVNKIIIEAHAQGASDIHIESNPGNRRRAFVFARTVTWRTTSICRKPIAIPSFRGKIMADLDISEHRHPQDGKIDFARHGPLGIELRVAIIPTANNLEDVVLRILGGAEPMPLEQVGFSRRTSRSSTR